MNFKFALYLLSLALLAPTQNHPNQETLKIIGGKLKSSLSVCADAGVGVLSSQTEGEIQYEPTDCFSSAKEALISPIDFQLSVPGSLSMLVKELENHGAAGDQASASCGEASAAANVSQSNKFLGDARILSESHASACHVLVHQSHQLQLSSSATGACTPWDLSCVAAAAGSFIVSEQETSVVFQTSSYSMVAEIIAPVMALEGSFAGGFSVIGPNGETIFSKAFGQPGSGNNYEPVRIRLQPGVLYTLKVWSTSSASVGVLSSCGTEEENLNNVHHSFFCRFDFPQGY